MSVETIIGRPPGEARSSVGSPTFDETKIRLELWPFEISADVPYEKLPEFLTRQIKSWKIEAYVAD